LAKPKVFVERLLEVFQCSNGFGTVWIVILLSLLPLIFRNIPEDSAHRAAFD
jgi:hypothetical protein